MKLILLVLFINLSTNTVCAEDPPISHEQLMELGYELHDPVNGAYSLTVPKLFNFGSDLGYVHPAGKKVMHLVRTQKQVVFNTAYSLDEYSRRINPEVVPGEESEFVALFGGSFTFGTGVRDNETISAHMNELSSKYFVYNYGVAGSAPNMWLAKIKQGNLKKEIAQPRGHAFFVHLYFHVFRVNGFLQQSWMEYTPYFRKTSQGMIRDGTIEKTMPLRTWLFRRMRDWGYVQFMGQNFPAVRTSHIDYDCDLIVESKHEFLRQFPSSKFTVYLYPSGEHDEWYHQHLKKCLSKNQIDYMDGVNLPDKEHSIPIDGHPSASAYKLMAKHILKYLREEKSSSQSSKAL